MDRMSPRRRPHRANVGTQSWQRLLFMHWTAPVEAVRALVPRSLELDLWQGEAWIGLVPFAMEHVRPRPVPKRLSLDFLETNLRTYVYTGDQPGVYFFSLEAASRLAVAAARFFFGLPYHFARMRLDDDGAGNFTYDTVREKGEARHHVTYHVGEPIEKGPLEDFLVERYLLFVERRGRLQRAQVHHHPYPLRAAQVTSVEDSLMRAAGLPGPDGPPRHACFCDGVDVEVFAPEDV